MTLGSALSRLDLIHRRNQIALTGNDKRELHGHVFGKGTEGFGIYWAKLTHRQNYLHG